MTLTNWTGVPLPERKTLSGRYVRLEPLDPGAHTASLFEASAAPGAEDRFRYMPEPVMAEAEFDEWVARVARGTDPLFFAVVDVQTGRAEGRQALMRIDAANGVIEVGSIVWGPNLARTRGATEAIFLMAEYVFGLGYRRFEWKCNDQNEPSKNAAMRFGFLLEGVFRQHMVIKGKNRDTAWFSITDSEWSELRAGYTTWLDPENFDADGRQLAKLVVRDARTTAD
ncbi:MAG: Protein export cytoplasm protein SecA ATPase helicase [Glaciihabitans sp.]|nr:Protein export cytoplasm protein SecA ATPase helicase [Glaciihabitans sp.]